MDDELTLAGVLNLISGWISTIGDFAYNHIGLTLVLFWCFILFVMTETAKPFIRRLIKAKEDQELVTKALPQILGVATGWAIFPALVATTPWGASHPTGGAGGAALGSLGGLLVGFLAVKIYDLSRNGKVIRFTQLVVRKVAKKIPFLKISDEDIKFIETTVKGQPAVTKEMLAKMVDDDPEA